MTLLEVVPHRLLASTTLLLIVLGVSLEAQAARLELKSLDGKTS